MTGSGRGVNHFDVLRNRQRLRANFRSGYSQWRRESERILTQRLTASSASGQIGRARTRRLIRLIAVLLNQITVGNVRVAIGAKLARVLR